MLSIIIIVKYVRSTCPEADKEKPQTFRFVQSEGVQSEGVQSEGVQQEGVLHMCLNGPIEPGWTVYPTETPMKVNTPCIISSII